MYENEAKMATDRPGRILGGEPMGARQSATAVLKDQADRLRREAHALESLAYQLEHMVMSSEAEQALWQMAVNARRT